MGISSNKLHDLMAHLEYEGHCRQANLWQSLLHIKTIVS